MRSYGWRVELDSFNANTPYGLKPMANVIATLPIGKKFDSNKFTDSTTFNRVIFACHYDSKLFRSFRFVAATDSAVPCALLLDMAKFLSQNFGSNNFMKQNRHIQFLFFDGEEAFKTWTATDSLYGSRNYANKLTRLYGQKAFDSMDLFVLLDLLGGHSSVFPNYFWSNPTSNQAYILMNKIGRKFPFLIKKSKCIFLRTKTNQSSSFIKNESALFQICFWW